ncbi:hypothetical protein L9F63_026004 [Diploptera punctata]|uniref:Uncharacterized protein n=1 Tax=Diploptera punctata TaxID=6984 RepID=A0AAD8E2J3_DIPPU|nr:hypothetical protein L9F63_026004 [Diploptera punctata]
MLYQLLKFIWEEVSRRFNCSWLEVLEFRENHIGTPESAAKGLIYHFHHRQYQEQHQHQLAYHPMDAYGTAARFHQSPPAASCMYAGYYNYPPYSYTLPQQPRYRGMISPQQALPPVMAYPIPPPVHPVAYQVLKSQDLYPTNGHHPHFASQIPVAPIPLQNGYAVANPMPSAPAPVPTGQLIELDMTVPQLPQQNSIPEPPRTIHQHQQTSTVKKMPERTPDPVNHSYTASLQKIENQPLTSGKTKEDGIGSFESWDYVFRNLESQGYSKDLGERPDILSPSPERMINRNRKEDPPVKDLEETLMELRLEEYNKKTLPTEHRPLKINEALQKIKIDSDHPRASPGKSSPGVEAVDGSISAYDNMSSPPKENPERERPVTIATASSKTISNNHIQLASLPQQLSTGHY